MYLLYAYIVFVLFRTSVSIQVKTDEVVFMVGEPCKEVLLKENVWLSIRLENCSSKQSTFVVVDVHSQSNKVLLSMQREPFEGKSVNATNAALMVPIMGANNTVTVYALCTKNISVLLCAAEYGAVDPVPGGAVNSNRSVATPMLFLNPQLLTTNVSIPPASFRLSDYSASAEHLAPNFDLASSKNTLSNTGIYETARHNGSAGLESSAQNLGLLYEVFLSYTYEGNLNEKLYWDELNKTSSSSGVRAHATRVAQRIVTRNETDAALSYTLVSYSGVGAVVNVIVSRVLLLPSQRQYELLSNGSLYSAAVSYGCDFIPDEKYRCTKLINPLTQVLCASFVFIGVTLTLFGHRWLNFTLFTAGFLAAWFLLFVIFIHVPRADPHTLGVATFLYSLSCGAAWVFLWHHFARPFLSAILVILEAALLVAMTITHFIKYALVPTHHNLAVFIVVPILFAALLVAYSIKNIKTVHIFSCSFLGSYAFVMPFSFYFGATLNYIVINAVSAMTVSGFTTTIGFPPFQYSDVVLLCLWAFMLCLGVAYQLYREWNSPPFLPPNTQCWRAAKRVISFVCVRVRACCHDQDEQEFLQQRSSDSTEQYDTLDDESAVDSLGNNSVNQRSGPSTMLQRLQDGLFDVRNTVASAFRRGGGASSREYESFPQYTGELVSEGVSPVCDTSGPEPQPRPELQSLSQRILSIFDAMRGSVELTLSRIRGRKRLHRVLAEDTGDDSASSGSSDGDEVDRRAVGIFGDSEAALAETPEEGGSMLGESDGDDSQFVDAMDRRSFGDVPDLSDRHQHEFASTQLSLQP